VFANRFWDCHRDVSGDSNGRTGWRAAPQHYLIAGCVEVQALQHQTATRSRIQQGASKGGTPTGLLLVVSLDLLGRDQSVPGTQCCGSLHRNANWGRRSPTLGSAIALERLPLQPIACS
jgi:hypothetical protein